MKANHNNKRSCKFDRQGVINLSISKNESKSQLLNELALFSKWCYKSQYFKE